MRRGQFVGKLTRFSTKSALNVIPFRLKTPVVFYFGWSELRKSSHVNSYLYLPFVSCNASRHDPSSCPLSNLHMNPS
jgi:hypothetical protein